MIANKWMKWAAAAVLAAAFPAMAMAHTHKTGSVSVSTVVPHAKTYSVHHKKSHNLSTKRRSASKLHARSHKAKPMHTKHHKATRLHSKKKTAVTM
jgi:hypothetical protein